MIGIIWRHVAQAFMVSVVIVIFDKDGDLAFKVAGQAIIFE